MSEDSISDLPSVQVGDPFWEKLILEASMEIIETGAVVGMQDMGAAGITCSTSEMSAKTDVGMDVWLDKVPMRQPDMKGWELLLSESQERMLVIIEKGREKEVEKEPDGQEAGEAGRAVCVEGGRAVTDEPAEREELRVRGVFSELAFPRYRRTASKEADCGAAVERAECAGFAAAGTGGGSGGGPGTGAEQYDFDQWGAAEREQLRVGWRGQS